MKRRLKRDFFLKPTLTVSKELLGKYLIHKTKKGILSGKIVETEAYIGPQDKASHAFGGKVTPRNLAEYLKGGHIYIYLVYGMYWQFNVSTAKEGKPECVLIRALEPAEGIEPMIGNRYNIRSEKKIREIRAKFVKIRDLANGPGKLCQALELSKKHYELDTVKSKEVWLEDRGQNIKKSDIIASVRIGIDYAKEWAKKPWRFYIKDSPFVSKI